MKVLVPCAGFGTRLGAQCQVTPKPLLTVGDRPLVAHTLVRLARSGFSSALINTHHLAEQFPAALGDGTRWGLRIEYIQETRLLGVAGTVRALASRLSEGVLIHFGDIVTDHELGALLTRHRSAAQGGATMLVHKRVGSNSCALLDADRRVRRFYERPKAPPPTEGLDPWVFSGLCVLSPEVVGDIAHGSASDLCRDIFPALARAGRLFADCLDGYRCAIDSPARLAMVRAALESGLLSRLRPVPLHGPSSNRT